MIAVTYKFFSFRCLAFQITENVFAGVSDRCKELHSLNLQGCFIMDNTVADIAAGCPNLEYLCLSSCPQITDRSLFALANSCLYLKYDFIGTSSVPKFTVIPLLMSFRNCFVASRVFSGVFRDLELAGCALLTDSGFASLAKNCHELERMDLEDCLLITDLTLDSFSRGCPCLINLVNIYFCLIRCFLTSSLQ